MFVSSNRVEPAFVNVARKGLNGQRAGLRIRVVPRHLLKERARCDHCHLHREIVMGRSELLDRRVSELVLAESTREVDLIHQIIPIVREDHERVVVLISNGSSHTLSALQKKYHKQKE